MQSGYFRHLSPLGVGDNIEKNYRQPIYRHFSNCRQNYRYRYVISKFIGDLKELSAKLSISKLTGDLSKNYRYRKKITYRPTLSVGGPVGRM